MTEIRRRPTNLTGRWRGGTTIKVGRPFAMSGCERAQPAISHHNRSVRRNPKHDSPTSLQWECFWPLLATLDYGTSVIEISIPALRS